ncbi:MAG: hypothetical protein JWR67_1747, partial [Mucilaginibacter sp.]|nr:hypothetical protein [Mucilaginibacter sp.]
MKLSHLLLFAFLAAFTSCNWGVPKKQPPGITKDTLNYTYETIKQRAADCGNKSDSSCTVAQIKYPVFRNAKLLNDSVIKKLTNLFGVNKTDTSLQLMTADFLKTYSDFKK